LGCARFYGAIALFLIAKDFTKPCARVAQRNRPGNPLHWQRLSSTLSTIQV
jgi:hypothetical protein